MRTSSLLTAGIVVIFLFGNLLEAGFSRPESQELIKLKKTNCGGVGRAGREGYSNSLEIDALARFAVQEHNKKENALLEYVRVLKAKEQVVAGKLYHLIVEAMDAGVKKAYEVKVWVKPWMNFKQLQEFKPVSSSFTSLDLGIKRD